MKTFNILKITIVTTLAVAFTVSPVSAKPPGTKKDDNKINVHKKIHMPSEKAVKKQLPIKAQKQVPVKEKIKKLISSKKSLANHLKTENTSSNIRKKYKNNNKKIQDNITKTERNVILKNLQASLKKLKRSPMPKHYTARKEYRVKEKSEKLDPYGHVKDNRKELYGNRGTKGKVTLKLQPEPAPEPDENELPPEEPQPPEPEEDPEVPPEEAPPSPDDDPIPEMPF